MENQHLNTTARNLWLPSSKAIQIPLNLWTLRIRHGFVPPVASGLLARIVIKTDMRNIFVINASEPGSCSPGVRNCGIFLPGPPLDFWGS